MCGLAKNDRLPLKQHSLFIDTSNYIFFFQQDLCSEEEKKRSDLLH